MNNNFKARVILWLSRQKGNMGTMNRITLLVGNRTPIKDRTRALNSLVKSDMATCKKGVPIGQKGRPVTQYTLTRKGIKEAKEIKRKAASGVL